MLNDEVLCVCVGGGGRLREYFAEDVIRVEMMECCGIVETMALEIYRGDP